uniref:glucosaminidase domain-containing protein n=1 Tax=Clostridium perfringens TaxID=1502 RepID=UPI0032DB31B4
MKKISIGVLIASFFMPIFLMMSMLMAIGNTTTSSGPSGPVVPSESGQAFIEAVAPIAQETFKEYGVFPSITLAQAILESGWGQSALATEGNN